MTATRFTLFTLMIFMLGCTECRVLLTEGAGATTETPANGRSCATVCQSPLLLAAFPTTKQPTSYACTAQNLPGYQSGNGATTCIVANTGATMETPDYSCVCLAPSQLQGLGKPDSTGSCTSSCPPYAGQMGTPVVAGANKNVCLAASEAGTTNRFGYTTSAGCTYASGTAVQTSNSFSCVCAYGGVKTPSPSGNIASLVAAAPLATLPKPQVQLPTAG